MKSRPKDQQRGGRVVFALTAAQLEQLRHPEDRLKRFRAARRDPREQLVAKGLLDYSGMTPGGPIYARTPHGDAVLRLLDRIERTEA